MRQNSSLWVVFIKYKRKKVIQLIHPFRILKYNRNDITNKVFRIIALLAVEQEEMLRGKFPNGFLNGGIDIDNEFLGGFQYFDTHISPACVIENKECGRELDETEQYEREIKLFYDRVMESYIRLAAKLSEDKGELIDRIIEFIKDNYYKQISLQIVADEFDMSLTYVSQYFKKATGMNFIDFVRDIRLEKAKEILKDRKISINEVARKTGFETVNTFIKVFKKYNGITPGEYKKLWGYECLRIRQNENKLERWAR